MGLSRRTLIHLSVAAGLVAALYGVGEVAKWDAGIGPMDAAGWRPIAWTLAPDGHAPGRAWRGHELEVHVRSKLRYLDKCDDGIASDEQLERASDIALLDKGFAPLGPGRRARVTDLFGRARLYEVKTPDGSRRQAEAIVVSYQCHLFTALMVGAAIDEPKRRIAHRFLESNTVQVPVNREFGSR